MPASVDFTVFVSARGIVAMNSHCPTTVMLPTVHRIVLEALLGCFADATAGVDKSDNTGTLTLKNAMTCFVWCVFDQTSTADDHPEDGDTPANAVSADQWINSPLKPLFIWLVENHTVRAFVLSRDVAKTRSD